MEFLFVVTKANHINHALNHVGSGYLAVGLA